MIEHDEPQVDLSDLVGDRVLTGVALGEEPRPPYLGADRGQYEDCQTISFILDGVTYTAVEDPEDGYRSSMNSLMVSGVAVANTFQPVAVICRMSENAKDQVDDVLEIVDAQNGKVILRVGTANTDDYYPWFVAEWTPELMHCNAAACPSTGVNHEISHNQD